MFTLNDDSGEITIDFTTLDPENPEAEPTVTSVVVAPPPTFGAYKRLRAEIDRINRDRDELTKKLREDDSVGVNQMTSQINSFTEDQLLEWWKLVMVGDESYRGQAVGESRPPEDFEEWPTYLVANESMNLALSHWKTVPLARGERPAQATK